jgi:hypothetical protein
LTQLIIITDRISYLFNKIAEGMVSCFFCRKRIWYRRDLSNPFARNKEKTHAYECTNCKVIFLVKNESGRKSRGTRDYWKDKSIVRGKVVKVLVKDASDVS